MRIGLAGDLRGVARMMKHALEVADFRAVQDFPSNDGIGDCKNRKPNPGMLRTAFARFPLRKQGSFLLGDQPSDLAAAEKFEIQAALLDDTGPYGSENAQPNERNTMTLEHFIARRAQVLDDMNAMSATIEHAAQIVANCLNSGGRLLACGNGGSDSRTPWRRFKAFRGLKSGCTSQ